MTKSKMLILSLALTSSLLFQACSATDIVKSNGIKTFKSFADASNNSISSSDTSWVYTSPSKDTFKWSKDFSLGKSDLAFELDAKPFIDAGLDTSKLPTDIFSYDEASGKLTINFDLGNEKLDINSNASAADTFGRIIEKYRTNLGYHEKLQHFGMSLPGDNKFEWAKDLATNDKDVVFVLNPKPFIEAGVKGDRVDGWIFTKMDGKDLFLKPFNIK